MLQLFFLLTRSRLLNHLLLWWFIAIEIPIYLIKIDIYQLLLTAHLLHIYIFNTLIGMQIAYFVLWRFYKIDNIVSAGYWVVATFTGYNYLVGSLEWRARLLITLIVNAGRLTCQLRIDVHDGRGVNFVIIILNTATLHALIHIWLFIVKVIGCATRQRVLLIFEGAHNLAIKPTIITTRIIITLILIFLIAIYRKDGPLIFLITGLYRIQMLIHWSKAKHLILSINKPLLRRIIAKQTCFRLLFLV